MIAVSMKNLSGVLQPADVELTSDFLHSMDLDLGNPQPDLADLAR